MYNNPHNEFFNMTYESVPLQQQQQEKHSEDCNVCIFASSKQQQFICLH